MDKSARKRILAVIPARGGSKRLVRKNIRMLAGKTLIEYALDCASHCCDITDIVCASDSDEILQCANQYFSKSVARVNSYVIKLPECLTLDNSLLTPVIRYCIDGLELRNSGTAIDTVVLLQPTSPFRHKTDLSKAISLHKTSGKDVVSVSLIPSTLEKLLYVDESGFIHKLTSKDTQLSQQGTNIFRQNGAVYVVRRKRIYSKETWVDSDCIAYEMPAERGIDIDTEGDLRLAEMMLHQGVIQEEAE
jgi:CMP-N,N'-diacetyllegionaminic acid synthase